MNLARVDSRDRSSENREKVVAFRPAIRYTESVSPENSPALPAVSYLPSRACQGGNVTCAPHSTRRGTSAPTPSASSSPDCSSARPAFHSGPPCPMMPPTAPGRRPTDRPARAAGEHHAQRAARMQQIVVTGKYADGTRPRPDAVLRDCACEAADHAPPSRTASSRRRRTAPTDLVVKAGGQTAQGARRRQGLRQAAAGQLPQRGDRRAQRRRLQRRRLPRHAVSGKNGFKLSLRGFDPAADYLQLTRDVLGRRTDRHDPDASLILLKGARPGAARGRRSASPPSSVPGQAAARLARRGPAATTRPTCRPLKTIEVLPGSRVLRPPRPAGSSSPSWPLRRRHASAT